MFTEENDEWISTDSDDNTALNKTGAAEETGENNLRKIN